jgi:hypothetical protein
MILVKMTRDMRPFQKDHEALVSPAVGKKLIADGDATKVRDYPATPAGGAKPKPPPPAKTYKTK